MTGARLLSLCLLLLFLLPACAPEEPVNGCVLAAANQREVLRAQAFLHPAIPARILGVWHAGPSLIGHAALVYRLDGGWFVYDDTTGSRRLDLPASTDFPAPLAAGRAAFPVWEITGARWLDPAR